MLGAGRAAGQDVDRVPGVDDLGRAVNVGDVVASASATCCPATSEASSKPAGGAFALALSWSAMAGAARASPSSSRWVGAWPLASAPSRSVMAQGHHWWREARHGALLLEALDGIQLEACEGVPQAA